MCAYGFVKVVNVLMEGTKAWRVSFWLLFWLCKQFINKGKNKTKNVSCNKIVILIFKNLKTNYICNSFSYLFIYSTILVKWIIRKQNFMTEKLCSLSFTTYSSYMILQFTQYFNCLEKIIQHLICSRNFVRYWGYKNNNISPWIVNVQHTVKNDVK